MLNILVQSPRGSVNILERLFGRSGKLGLPLRRTLRLRWMRHRRAVEVGVYETITPGEAELRHNRFMLRRVLPNYKETR